MNNNKTTRTHELTKAGAYVGDIGSGVVGKFVDEKAYNMFMAYLKAPPRTELQVALDCAWNERYYVRAIRRDLERNNLANTTHQSETQ